MRHTPKADPTDEREGSNWLASSIGAIVVLGVLTLGFGQSDPAWIFIGSGVISTLIFYCLIRLAVAHGINDSR